MAGAASWWQDPWFYVHMVVLYAVLGVVLVYFAVQSVALVGWATWQCCFRKDQHTAKSIRINVYRLIFSMVKVVMLVFFVYFYHFPDRLIEMIPSLQVVSKVLLLFFGLGWFFDLFFTIMLDERRLKTASDGQLLASLDKQVRKDNLFNAVGRLFFWRKPSPEAQREVQSVMCDRRLQLVPMGNCKCSRVSLDQYLFVFTLGHLVVVTYKLFAALEDAKFNQAFDVYCMFPLGVFAGEKVITVFTGFTPWWTEWMQTREKSGSQWALVGFFINVLDFGMLFYSILDDCLGYISGLNTFGVLCMMVVDAVFDFLAIGKTYLEDEEPSERYAQLSRGPSRVAPVRAQFLPQHRAPAPRR